MNRRRGAFAAVLTLLALSATESPAWAQGRARHASPWIQTPNGPVYNPALSPEWRQSGGNPMVYQQMMQQRMMRLQQQNMTKQYQEMQKQQQAFEKWYKDQKAKKDKGQKTDPAFDELLKQQQAADAAAAAELAKQQAKQQAKKDAAQHRKDIIKDRMEKAKQKQAADTPSEPSEPSSTEPSEKPSTDK